MLGWSMRMGLGIVSLLAACGDNASATLSDLRAIRVIAMVQPLTSYEARLSEVTLRYAER